MSCRRSNPLASSSLCSDFISAGFEGGFVARKSSTGSTSPVRKKCFHNRFAIAAEKKSLLGDVIQLASTTRGFCPGPIGVSLRSSGRAARN